MNAKEEGIWKSHDICDMIVEEVEDLKNPVSGDKVGESLRKVTIAATIEDLEGGKAIKQEQIDGYKQTISECESHIANLGKVPAMTSEMHKLQQNLEAIEKNRQKAEQEKKLKESKKEIAVAEEFIATRQKIIDARPE